MSRRKKNRSKFSFKLDAQTQRGIATVFFFALAAFMLLALFDFAGSAGIAMDQALSHIFGWDKIVVPFFILAFAIYLLSPERMPLKISNGIGFFVFFLGMNPLLHLLTFKGAIVTANAIQTAGGKIGLLFAEPFIPVFGVAGAIIFFTAVFGASLVLIFNTSLQTIIEWILRVLKILQKMAMTLISPLIWIFSQIKDRKARSKMNSENAQLEDTEIEGEIEDGHEDQPESIVASAHGAIRKNADKASAPLPVKQRRRPKVDVPLELLTRHDQKPTSGDIEGRQIVIQRTLETFGIPVDMGEVSVGPTVTQFTFKPAEGIKLNRITALHNDLALALAAHPIRIEAPIPGKSLVGVEVPNQNVALVGLRELLEAREWRDRKSPLNFALGRDVSGKPWLGDICKMPHLLVAGATGSGKSVCLNAIIMSLLFSNGPDDLKVILVDPKRVEFPVYNGIPHLITPVITDIEKTINAMKWAVRQMNQRFDLLSKLNARDIATYNQRSKEKLPYIVMIIDELADLMVSNKQEVESQVVRLAQMSRAVGIHLILATQRPSVDVITGLIKANIPARIAFSVASLMDSRTILDQSGAEKLIGRGDMLFSTAEMSSPRRIQGVFVADDEINRVVEYLKSKYEPADYDPEVTERSKSQTSFLSGISDNEDNDPLLEDAKEEIIRAGKASASLLQRRLKVGYARAARLLDLLESEGFIGPSDGAKPREILKADFTNQMPPKNTQSAAGFSQVEDLPLTHSVFKQPAKDEYLSEQFSDTDLEDFEEEIDEQKD